MTTFAVTSASSLRCQASTCFRISSKFLCIRSTPTETQSIKENDFECLASTGVNTPETMFSTWVFDTIIKFLAGMKSREFSPRVVQNCAERHCTGGSLGLCLVERIKPVDRRTTRPVEVFPRARGQVRRLEGSAPRLLRSKPWVQRVQIRLSVEGAAAAPGGFSGPAAALETITSRWSCSFERNHC